MEKPKQWINTNRHSIAVDNEKQPLTNENGDLIVLDNTTRKCIFVPNTEDALEIFGFGYSSTYSSPSGSQKDSLPKQKLDVQNVLVLEPLLWNSRTPSQKDIMATQEMLAMVGSKRYQDMFNDQCTVKIRVWKMIYKELTKKGFRVADSVIEGGIKCHQKWRNLEKSYRNYLYNSMDSNCPTPKKPPPYFETLHDILKTKKKYANVVACTQTVVVNSNVIDPDVSDSSGSGGGQLTNLDETEELNYVYVQDGDHCYVDVDASPAKMFKRERVEQQSKNSPTRGSTIGGGGDQKPSRGNGINPQEAVVPQSPQNVEHGLEQILKKVELVHRDMKTMIEWQTMHLEKVIQENTVEKERLVSVFLRLLPNMQGDNKTSMSDVN